MIVQYRDAPNDPTKPASAGAAQFLDLQSGHVFDAAGNTIAKWSPSDNDKTAMMADYASDYALSVCAHSMKGADPERAAQMMSSRSSGWDDDAQLLDLGPTDVHIPAALPNFASGYRNFTPIADIISPPLLVQKQVNDYWQFAKEDAFQRALPNVGAGGATVGEISPRLSFAQYSCVERALGGFVTTQTEANADAPLNILQATTKRVMNALILEREIRVQAMLRTTANWNAAQVTTLLAGFQWNQGASSDPVKDLHTLMEASYGDVTGIVMAENVWHAFIRNPSVRAYYAYKSNTAAMPKPGDMQAILELPPIYVSCMKYINSAGALVYVWGPDVVAFRQPEQNPPTTQDDVATSYTFRWNIANPKDGVSNGGFIVRQFYVQDRGSMGGNKLVVVHNDAEKITGQFIGGIIASAFQ